MAGTGGVGERGRKRARQEDSPAHQEHNTSGVQQQPQRHSECGLFDPDAQLVGIGSLAEAAAATAAAAELHASPHDGGAAEEFNAGEAGESFIARDISSSPPLFCGGNDFEGGRPMAITSPILHTRR